MADKIITAAGTDGLQEIFSRNASCGEYCF